MSPKEKTTSGKEIVQTTDKQILAQPDQRVNPYDIAGYLEMRKEFITQVNKIMVEGKDYHVIQNRKSLAKGGAEKIASIFGWAARFEKDKDVAESFNDIKGLIAFVCVLSKGNVLVGEGRGAATLDKNGKDPNKTIKMAQKSAYIDAVLRASGLSDFFTQDLEDMDKQQIAQMGTPRNYNAVKPQPVGAPNHTGFYCSVHDNTIVLHPAGKTKAGRAYNAFYACTEKVNGKFCKETILNSEGEAMWRDPDTGELKPELPL